MKRLIPILGLSALLGLNAACGVASKRNGTNNQGKNSAEAQSTSTMSQDIAGVVTADSRFSTLVSALKAADLVDTLHGKGPFTVFAPTNEAFAKLGEDAVKNLLNDKERLISILLYHVVSGSSVDSTQASGLTEAKMTNGSTVKITAANGTLKINNATVIIKDIKTSNGIIHVIDAVLVPEVSKPTDPQQPAALKDIVTIASEDGRFSTLVTAVKAAGLASTLQGAGPFTVFAPTDEAFAKLGTATINSLLADQAKLRYVLLYHVISGKAVSSATAATLTEATMTNGATVAIAAQGDSLRINTAQVIIKDIQASNGVIHVLDTVLLPPQDLASVVATDGRFKTLKTALEATNLFATLRGKTPQTVFAPTDAAFNKLGTDVVQALLKSPENLKDILLYHVISGYAANSTLIINLGTLKMANEKTTQITHTDGVLRINDSTIIEKDIVTQNGIIHVIDSVLVP